MAVKIRPEEEQEIDKFHYTSLRNNAVISQSNLLILASYLPTVEFETKKFNQPLAQLLFNRGKSTQLFTRHDAYKLSQVVYRIKEDCKMFPESVGHEELSFGRIEVNSRYIRFVNTGEKYNAPMNDIGWLALLHGALLKFISSDNKMEKYPFSTLSGYRNGVTTNSMFQLTHHGDESYGQVPSFLRYVHATDGKGGQLTLQYAQTQLHIGTSHTRGVNWLAFVSKLRQAIVDAGSIFEKDCHAVNIPFYKDHPVLGVYNCYVSAIKHARGITLTINTDLSHLNSKTSLTINKENYGQLVTFLTAVQIYSEKSQ